MIRIVATVRLPSGRIRFLLPGDSISFTGQQTGQIVATIDLAPYAWGDNLVHGLTCAALARRAS